MKSEERHRLEENELALWIGNLITTIKPYSKVIAIGAVAVVLGFAIGSWWRATRSTKTAAASRSLHLALSKLDPVALSDVVEQYPGTPIANLAALAAADIYLQEACDQLLTNKALAVQQLTKALELYRQVQQSTKDPLLLARATLGTAQCYETLAGTPEGQGQLDRALEAYREVLKRWPNSVFASVAKERLASLETDQAKLFYDKLAKYEPASTTAGTLPEQLPFDLSNLPEPESNSTEKVNNASDATSGNTDTPAANQESSASSPDTSSQSDQQNNQAGPGSQSSEQ